jgi:hypothetical protein
LIYLTVINIGAETVVVVVPNTILHAYIPTAFEPADILIGTIAVLPELIVVVGAVKANVPPPAQLTVIMPAVKSPVPLLYTLTDIVLSAVFESVISFEPPGNWTGISAVAVAVGGPWGVIWLLTSVNLLTANAMTNPNIVRAIISTTIALTDNSKEPFLFNFIF